MKGAKMWLNRAIYCNWVLSRNVRKSVMDDLQKGYFVMQLIPSFKTEKSSKTKRFLAGMVVIVFALLAIFISSKTAQAGLLSYVNSIFGSEEASAKVDASGSGSNSQKIALLQAAVNLDPNPHKTSESTPLADGGFLMADVALSENAPRLEEVNTQISIYTIREGDTLSEIGEMFGVSVNTIMWANDLTRASAIQPGQTIIILPISGINYTVKKGDTITGIVEYYKADLEEVLQYNDIAISSVLTPGQTILIPDAELHTAVPSKVVKSSAAGTPNYSGYYIRPIRGGVKTQGIHGHNGVDLAAPIGTPIYASASGVVIVSNVGGWNGGYGNFIIISHANGTQTVYSHNTKNLVQAGDYVEQGDQIATVGTTGKSTGPHVHFEIRGARNPF